jgi:hypothetical protein
MKNRFLNGVSFLPLFAPEKGAGDGGEQPELALEAGEADFAEKLEAAASEDDPNDLNHSSADEDKDAETVTAEAAAKEPEKAEGDAEAEVADDPAAELEQLRKTAKALGKRVSVLSKEKRDLSTKLQQTIKEVPAEPAEGETDGEALQRSDFKSKAEFDIAVQAEADRRVAVAEFNKQCNAVETAGVKAFGDKWAKAKSDLAMLDDQGRIPIDILSVALETDDPARVLFVLGNDIEKATELMGMTPIKRAIAMDKIASGKPADRPQSKAPPPVEPLGGKGSANDRPSDRDTDEEWNRKEAIRERQVAETRRKARGY